MYGEKAKQANNAIKKKKTCALKLQSKISSNSQRARERVHDIESLRDLKLGSRARELKYERRYPM